MEKLDATLHSARLIGFYAGNYLKSNFDWSSISFKQVQVIELIADHSNNGLPQKKIEEYLDVSHPTLVSLLSEMVGDGLVQCRYDNGDKRCKNVYLTDTAMELYGTLCETQKGFANICCEAISDKEKEQLCAILGKIAEHLKEKIAL